MNRAFRAEEKMENSLEPRQRRPTALIVVVAFAGFFIFASVDFFQNARTRQVFAAMGKANEARVKRGASSDSAEAFLADLRAIDLNYTKKELRPAFFAYVNAMEEELTLAKAGKETVEVEVRAKSAQAELLRIAKDY